MLLILWGEPWALRPLQIDRIDCLLDGFDSPDYIIMSTDPLIQARYLDSVYMPREADCLCEALCNTFHLWDQRTVMASGAADLTAQDCRRVLLDRDALTVWERAGEFLASVYATEATQWMLAMWAAARDWHGRRGAGGLDEAYRIYCPEGGFKQL